MRITVFALFIEILFSANAMAEVPSFDCSKMTPGSVGALVCTVPELTALDVKLSQIYRDAKAVDAKIVGSSLRVEQRGWIKGRDECWKAVNEVEKCVAESYKQRIAELQARYRLLSPVTTSSYFCEGNQANEMVVSFFDTEPKTIIAERGDKSVLLYQEKENAYQGQNVTLLFLENDLLKASFSYQAPVLDCRRRTRMHPSWDVDGNSVNDCEKDGSCDHTIDYSLPRK